MKNRSHRYGKKDLDLGRHGHDNTKCKMCLSMVMLCI